MLGKVSLSLSYSFLPYLTAIVGPLALCGVLLTASRGLVRYSKQFFCYSYEIAAAVFASFGGSGRETTVLGLRCDVVLSISLSHSLLPHLSAIVAPTSPPCFL